MRFFCMVVTLLAFSLNANAADTESCDALKSLGKKIMRLSISDEEYYEIGSDIKRLKHFLGCRRHGSRFAPSCFFHKNRNDGYFYVARMEPNGSSSFITEARADMRLTIKDLNLVVKNGLCVKEPSVPCTIDKNPRDGYFYVKSLNSRRYITAATNSMNESIKYLELLKADGICHQY